MLLTPKNNMRYAKVLFITLQKVIEQKNKSFVYFLMSLFVPLVMILFWRGANYSHQQFSFSTISTYYFFLVIVGAFLMPHQEEFIAEELIHQGNLGSYLMKPLSFFSVMLLEEAPWQILQSIFGTIAISIFFILFGNIFIISKSPTTWILSGIVFVLAYFLAFLYKMCLAFCGFWITEMGGVIQLSEIFLFTFAGYIGPLFIFPDVLAKLASILPFSYMIYFPVVAFQGRLQSIYIIEGIIAQLVWIIIFASLYGFLWKKGLKKFTAVGQ